MSHRIRLALALSSVLLISSGSVAVSAGDPAPAPAPGSVPPPASGLSDPATLRRLAKVMGTLLSKYLEDKSDPVKAAAWDDFLKGLSEDLKALPESGDYAGTAGLLKKMMARIGAGMSDPAKRQVMAEILGVIVAEVVSEMTRPATAPKDRAPRALRVPRPHLPLRVPRALSSLRAPEGDPLVAGGAHLHLVAVSGSPTEVQLIAECIDVSSTASGMGLIEGDTIVAIDGLSPTFETTAGLRRRLARRGELSLTVVRQGRRIELDRRDRK